jgi:hypothetical protein
MKIRPVEVEKFHAERGADKHEANNRFSQFCEVGSIITVQLHLVPYSGHTGVQIVQSRDYYDFH